MSASFLGWIPQTPLWALGLVVFALTAGAFFSGRALRRWSDHDTAGEAGKNDYEGFVVSAVFGLLALFLGFTFSLAIQRFEQRRLLVVSEANAIGTAYLRVQLLAPPHRERISQLIREHVDNELSLARDGYPRSGPQREKDDAVLTQIWSAALGALEEPKLAPLAFMLTEPLNRMIDLVAARQDARAAHVPVRVFIMLFAYVICTGGVMGYVIVKGRGNLVVFFMFLLMALSLLMIIDIDRPSSGRVRESQEAMEQLKSTLARQPPSVFDVWRTPATAP